MNRRYIITGGPGFGKTTLLDQLITLGFQGFQEAAREVIDSEFPAPMHNPDSKSNQLFFKRIVHQRITDYLAADPARISFFDRGLPDSLAFFKEMNRPPPASLLRSIEKHPYNGYVFVVPPWEEIFRQDEIRTETYNQASRLHQFLVEAYLQLDYRLIMLPKGSVEERIDVILSIVQ